MTRRNGYRLPDPCGRSSCLACRRVLTGTDHRLRVAHLEPARCGWCGAPQTDQARAELDPMTRARALDEVAG